MTAPTREQKFETRFAEWACPDLQFATPEAEAAYKERVQMFKDVVQLKKPVRVPIMLNSGIVPFAHAGITTEEAMYDYDKLGYAFKKYNQDFQTDTVVSCAMAVLAPAIIAQWFMAEKRGTAMGIWSAWVPLGTAIMLVVAPALVQSSGWQSVWWVGAAFAAVATILYLLFVRPAPLSASEPVARAEHAGTEPAPTPPPASCATARFGCWPRLLPRSTLRPSASAHTCRRSWPQSADCRSHRRPW